MNGKELLRKLRQILNEAEDSGFIDTRTSYEYLNEAAYNFVSKTNFLRASTTLTTIADQASYDLPTDFMKLFLRDSDNLPFIIINDGSNDHYSFFRTYSDVIYGNNTTPENYPGFFTISNNDTLPDRISSTTTSDGSATNGECTLADTAADFSDVTAGDMVSNATDGSDGIVLSKTSSTALVTSLFGGTNNDWTSGDSYVIQPQGKVKLQFDPPPATSAYTVTVHYIQRPSPVYSNFGAFSIPSQYQDAIVKYAAWLYKYRDREPNFGDALYLHYDKQTREANNVITGTYRKNTLGVNLKSRNRGIINGR